MKGRGGRGRERKREEERWEKRERLGMDSPGCIATAGLTESQG